MSKKLMSVAVNRSTRELIGYWIPKNGAPIVVKAYAVDDLEKKFNKKVKDYKSKSKLEKKMDKYIDNSFPDTEMFSGTMGG